MEFSIQFARGLGIKSGAHRVGPCNAWVERRSCALAAAWPLEREERRIRRRILADRIAQKSARDR